MTEHRNVLELDLPEIRDRDPYTRPCNHLVKTGADPWAEAPARWESKTLLVNRIRRAVDDIAIPRTTHERHYRRLRDLDPLKLPPLASQQDLERELRNRIDLLHGIIDIKIGSDEVNSTRKTCSPSKICCSP